MYSALLNVESNSSLKIEKDNQSSQNIYVSSEYLSTLFIP